MSEQHEDPASFDPSQHLTKVNGNPYLENKWRIKRFRSAYPAGRIVTELIALERDYAVCRATVTAIKDGAILGEAVGHKAQDAASFAAFVEKAESGAIGRALAHLGYGTQFAGDELDEAPPGTVSAPRPLGDRRFTDNDSSISSKQVGLIGHLVKEQRLVLPAVLPWVGAASVGTLSISQASRLIRMLKGEEPRPASGPVDAAAVAAAEIDQAYVTRDAQEPESYSFAPPTPQATPPAAPGSVAALVAELAWSPRQKPWAKAIAGAKTPSALDAIPEALDRAGLAGDAMLNDLLNKRWQEVQATLAASA